MKKSFLISFFTILVFSCKNSSQLNVEYKELLLIQDRQQQKIEQLKNQKEQFLFQIDNTTLEIKNIVGNSSTNYSEVSNNLVINNKLKLIQRRLAYANKLQEFENQTFQALQITNLILEDIKDKIALGNILKESELNQVLKDIDNIKKTSLPKTNDLAMNIKNSDLVSYEKIWNNNILKSTSSYKKNSTNQEQKDKIVYSPEKIEMTAPLINPIYSNTNPLSNWLTSWKVIYLFIIGIPIALIWLRKDISEYQKNKNIVDEYGITVISLVCTVVTFGLWMILAIVNGIADLF